MTRKFTFGKVAEDFRKGAAVARRDLSHTNRGKFVAARQVEILPMTAGGREGDPADYINISELTGEALFVSAHWALKHNPKATGVGISLGFDLWENVYEFAHRGEGFDYEPRIDHFEVDLPEELVAQLRVLINRDGMIGPGAAGGCYNTPTFI